tara:strand:- start:1783 stop:2196 length:414 start_codon:yes stop_codon:yes gene_type:complete
MNLIKNIFKYGIASAFAGIVCCVAPMILFQLGVIGGIYAISFADFFYKSDGSLGLFGWIIRIIGLLIVCYGIYRFNIKENCSLNSDNQKRINKMLFSVLLIIFSLTLFLSLEKLSSIYFDEYIVPAQKKEYQEKLTE